MRIFFYKISSRIIKTATTTKHKTIKISLRICRQYDISFRCHLSTTTTTTSPIISTTILLHKSYLIQQQQQQKQRNTKKFIRKLYQQQREQEPILLYYFQAQRYYSTAILNDSHDHNAKYAELQNFAKSLPTDGNKSSGNGKTTMGTLQQLQQCASYVDAAVAAAAVAAASISVASDYASPNAIKLEEAAIAADATDTLEDATQTLSSSTECLPTLRCFTVQLDFVPEPHELVGLTGDTKALGEWRLENCVPLHPQSDSDRRTWTANVMLVSSAQQAYYRYFIYTEDALGRKQIRRWETHLQPRTLYFSGSEAQIVDRFGVISSTNDVENVGAREVAKADKDVAASDGAQVNRGWLTFESIVQFKFEREHMFRLHDIDRFDPEHVQIKVETLDQTEHYVGVHVDVARLDYGRSHLHKQENNGATYKKGDVVIFHLTVADLSTNAFALLFYTPAGELIGRAHITPDMLKGSEGELVLDIVSPMTDEPTVVAELTLPYVIVRPYQDGSLLDFRTTYAHYWPKSWPNLDVGHRGNGRSYIADPPAECENTLASFMRAYESHADMIELDVHLTADGVPIVYHDFGMLTAAQNKKVTSRDQLEYVLIKDVTYEKLKQMRIFAMINEKPVEYPAHNAEPRIEHRIFPRLRDVLEALPKTLGIDVEIKWPQRTACGGVEAHQTIDKNFFVDCVLDTIIQHGCGRPLIFSSFDADICTMLRFKQNIYPVMFLTMGETKKWRPYMDLRTRNFVQAINNAQAFELAGTAPHAEDFLGDHGPALMQKAVKAGQIAVVWGDDCNSKERVKYFSAIGATAICYDRADLFMPEDKKRAFFNSSNLIAEFDGQCRRGNTQT